jgi:tRNA G18 (ribose-2'-O)-methylase SpoU
MGSTFRLPISDGTNAIETIRSAKALGFKVLAAMPRKGSALYDTGLDGRTLILIGGEGDGLQAEIENLADVTVSIPMAPYVDSLNVAAATAVILYEIRRQSLQK